MAEVVAAADVAESSSTGSETATSENSNSNSNSEAAAANSGENNASNDAQSNNNAGTNADDNAAAAASATPVPFVPEIYFAIRDYDPNADGQLNVVRGEPVYLLDDTDCEWWYAASPRTDQTGYIPALFIESKTHKDARDNSEKNKKIQLPPDVLLRRQSIRPTDSPLTPRHVVFHKKCSMLMDNGQTKLVPLAPPAKIRVSYVEEVKTEGNTNEETFAALGLVKVYAGIWNVAVTYKVVKMNEFTTVEEAIPQVVKKFNTAPDVKEKLKDPENYCLVLQSATKERVLKSGEKPAMELANLNDTERIGAKLMIKLKDTRPKDTIPVRIYGDEQSFKTISVDADTTIEEAMILAMQKFKLSDKNQYHLRVFVNGQEREMEDDDNIYELVTEDQNSGGATQHKFFIKRKPTAEEQRRQSVTNEQTDRRLLRIYGGVLDMDIAYKAILISRTMVADDVIQLALDRYDSLDPVSMYCLVMVVAGKDARILEDTDHPMDVQKSYEDMNPDKIDSIKMHLRRRDKQPGAVIKQFSAPQSSPSRDGPTTELRKTPFRVYCDWMNDKMGKKLFKPFLIGANDDTHMLFHEIMEKFDFNRMINEENRAIEIVFVVQDKEAVPLHPSDFPIKVRDKLLEERKPNITPKDLVLHIRETPRTAAFEEFVKPLRKQEEEEKKEEEEPEEEETEEEAAASEVSSSMEDLSSASVTSP